ncbi:MAG: oligosaccharide flippase family protein, partial [Paludibacteraceae bacterium]|nr:oligosaccharide flippase family protein [Paludibacteraceae bacterium]
MSEIKSLAKDTAIYGLSSIIGKFLNYLLVPLYTYVLARTEDYGIVTNLYAWTALLLVILTYGMETGFFRFANRDDYDPKQVYRTAYMTLLTTSALFALLVVVFRQPVANILNYPDHSEFVAMMFATVAVDAFACIPFAYLRYRKRPIVFAALKLLFVILNIAFNLLFLVVLGKNDVFYVFLSNILATGIQTLCLLPMTLPKGGRFSMPVLRDMLRYSLPLLVLGVAGIMNQTLDRILFPYLYTGADAQAQLGIYGACFKVAMVMMMFTQAFRYAYEPFVFAKHKDRQSVEAYADAMKYYLIFSYLILLGVIFYL